MSPGYRWLLIVVLIQWLCSCGPAGNLDRFTKFGVNAFHQQQNDVLTVADDYSTYSSPFSAGSFVEKRLNRGPREKVTWAEAPQRERNVLKPPGDAVRVAMWPPNWCWRVWSTRALRPVERLKTTAAELYYLWHLRSAAASPCGSGLSSSECGSAASLLEQFPIFIAMYIRVADDLAKDLRSFIRNISSLHPLFHVAVGVAASRNATTQCLACAVMLGLLRRLHLPQQFCSALTAAAFWFMLLGWAPVLRLVSVFMFGLLWRPFHVLLLEADVNALMSPGILSAVTPGSAPEGARGRHRDGSVRLVRWQSMIVTVPPRTWARVVPRKSSLD